MEAGDYLTPELISDVLSRLLAKSIGRFRCVCKDWKSLLSDSQFLKIHFNLQNCRTTKAVVSHGSSLISIDFANNNGGPVAILETLSSKHFYHRFRTEGSCDGLLLLIDQNNYELLIINPITRVSRRLPTVPVRLDYPCPEIHCGFGYNCSDDDDYAVVVFLEYSFNISLVYVLKRNCWKMAVKNPPFCRSGSCIYINGAIHMLAYRIEDYSSIIWAFDLASERFREVEQPKGFKEHVSILYINLLGGCLCLATRLRNTGIGNTNIWVMKEYGVSKFWSKYYTFTTDRLTKFNLFKPLFLWGGDEFMVGVADGRVTLCNLNKPQTISVVGERDPLLLIARTYWTFSDSLFSPNRNNVVDEPNEVQI